MVPGRDAVPGVLVFFGGTTKTGPYRISCACNLGANVPCWFDSLGCALAWWRRCQLMSNIPDNEFDLEKLFLPAWAQQEPSSAKYAKYEGETEPSDRRSERRGPRPPRREGGNRREGNRRPGERRPFAKGPGEQVRREQGPSGERGQRPGPRRGPPRERREPPAPLPEINVSVVPEEKVVESLAKQIKITGRAYPLFDIAQMILQKPERHAVIFGLKKNAENKAIQPLFVCALDDSLWLSDDEAVGHVLRKHFNTFYQSDKTATEPPKGKYTFVAQCGISGVILGPPNYHDYQNQLRKLHSERFSRMPFEVYKSRVKIVRDEAVVKQWVEEQSWKTEYICLNMPEPLKLPTREAVEQHFRENHKDNIIKPIESHTMSGTAARNLRSPELVRLVRSVWEDQRRFPLQIATVLSQQFAGHGLQFFKVNKTITHVSVARPHYLDLALTPVSDGVKRIVDYINANPKCTRRQLLAAVAPTPLPAPVPAPAPAVSAPETAEAPAPTPAAAAPAEPAETNAEQNALMGDLHWLIHQGHVIEFANGTLETAKKPLPRPPKKEPKPAEAPAEGATPAAPAEPSVEAAAETPVSDLAQPAQLAPTATDEPVAPAREPEASSAPAGHENQPESPEAAHNGPPPVPAGQPPAEKSEDIVPSPS